MKIFIIIIMGSLFDFILLTKKTTRKRTRSRFRFLLSREHTCTWKRHRLRFSGYEQASVHRGAGRHYKSTTKTERSKY